MKIEFDTLDKKPNLYSVLWITLALTVVVVLDLAGLLPQFLVSTILVTYYAAVAFLLIRAFKDQFRYNPYSYNTIYYIGFALYVRCMLGSQILMTWQIAHYSESGMAGSAFLQFLSTGKLFILLSLPFILVFSISMIVSNIRLIHREGGSLTNILGTILSLMLIGGFLFLYVFDYYVSGSEREVMIHDLITNFFSAVFIYFECMILGTIVAGAITARYEPEPDKDFLIILGCGLRADGTPTPLLQGRLDRAQAFAEKQYSLTGKHLTFITSGGKGPDEVVSESASMKQYLMDHGVPASRIIEEDHSTSTLENMLFSKEKILVFGSDCKVAFSTTNYHVFRSGLFARRVKMRAVGMGARTKWYFWPNAAVREFVGLVTEHRLKQGIILTCIIVFYLVLTWMSFKLL